MESSPGTVAARPGMAAQEAELWERWRSHANADARAQLLALHMPYARVVAASYYGKRFHDEIEFDEYLQLASLGLIEALDRFDPGVGVQFRTFAARRMHGAILDGLEQATEKQQQIAARQRLQAQRRESLSEAPAARASEQVLQYVTEAGLAFALGWILDGTGMIESSERAETVPFYRSVELRQLRERILDSVRSLPAQEKTVIQCHYLQEMTFEAVATKLGVSRGRVSQIHRAALQRLRDTLRRDACDVSA